MKKEKYRNCIKNKWKNKEYKNDIEFLQVDIQLSENYKCVKCGKLCGKLKNSLKLSTKNAIENEFQLLSCKTSFILYDAHNYFMSTGFST